MLRFGARYLTNTELLAILIGSGTGDKNANQVAQELLSVADGRLLLLSAMPLEHLVRQKGIGSIRAMSIAAALELGRRAHDEGVDMESKAVTTPLQVFQLMTPFMRNLDHEECWVLYLNRRNYLLGKEMICSGSLEKTIVDTRRILKRAIEKQAKSIILVHNHPASSPNPSEQDIHQTDTMKKALGTVEIELLDHVIITDGAFFSFEEERITKMR